MIAAIAIGSGLAAWALFRQLRADFFRWVEERLAEAAQ